MPSTPDSLKRALRRLFGAKKPPAVPSKAPAGAPNDTLLSLIERVQETPLDPRLCYQLGIALLRKGIDNDGVRYLDRAFRLDPLNVVRFVKAPDLKQIRLRDSVVTLLTRLRRDQEQRSYGAYA
ncbi:MAG TPA: hypothetical protein VGB18_02065 [Candidatus Thermoplasmatota archaeon]